MDTITENIVGYDPEIDVFNMKANAASVDAVIMAHWDDYTATHEQQAILIDADYAGLDEIKTPHNLRRYINKRIRVLLGSRGLDAIKVWLDEPERL